MGAKKRFFGRIKILCVGKGETRSSGGAKIISLIAR
jgi:hypothetical protein